MEFTLAHVCFTVSDLDRSLAFYCEALGMRMVFAFTKEDGSRYGAYVKAGPRQFIELFVGGSEPTGDQHSYKHICLEVADIEKAVAHLKQAGVEVGDVSLGMDQSYQAWLADPDGNKIELHSYTEKSWQNDGLEQ